METFYIITNRLKDQDFRITEEIRNYIEEHGKRCVLSEKDEEGHIVPGTVPGGMDCALVLGGVYSLTADQIKMNQMGEKMGAMKLVLAADDYDGQNIPLLGINMGTLGYLTEVELPQFREALDKLFAGWPDIEERMMMRGTIDGRREYMAMNDVVVTREGNLRVVHFNVYVNGALLNSYLADGVIISTPTGSTGYNLSAGGPVVEPTARMFVITPICSHALNASSVVLSAEDVIEVEICEGRYGRTEHALVTFDGAETAAVSTGDRVQIRRAKETTRLVKLSRESFMKIMREKMKGN